MKEIKKIANHYKSYSHSKLEYEDEINATNNIILNLYICKFNPKEMKSKAIYVILFEYFKKYIMLYHY
ncbi:hypothetical protein RFI_29285 [Reticulomyxa filosa]|uniref:Uncharacterized protein n=1 Tax=Reticulomyxa filosa TaxID=46433 RepID=X6M1R2_RETFI|nr:hypothetical protein RFI_29285 [Reticulomyxa filosa]|eukprot:ETO08103.1 hypothetical protein RFI_29285 [Reticulomyxa filosa]